MSTKWIWLIITIGSVQFFSACTKDNEPVQKTVWQQITDFPKEPLSTEEINSLYLMREEEKFAHDVYTKLFEKWGMNIFNSISNSEQTHTDAVLILIEKYELEDPATNNVIGEFTDTTLQRLYNEFVTFGSQSLINGLITGATIEDLDIYDLQELLKVVNNQDITFVYNNLLKGSRNHMRSFYPQIISNGGSYIAQYITQQELEDIINSPRENNSW